MSDIKKKKKKKRKKRKKKGKSGNQRYPSYIYVIETKKQKHALKWYAIGKQTTQIKKSKEIINHKKEFMPSQSDSNEVSEDSNEEIKMNIFEISKELKRKKQFT